MAAPRDAAEALGELARLTELASALVTQADNMLGRELHAGRVTPVPSADGTGRTAAPADAAAGVRDSAVAAVSGLGEAAALLRRMQMRAGDLQRTARAGVAGTADGPTLRAQYLIRCSPNGFPAVFHVRHFAPPRGRHLVVIGELADNHSTHLDSCVEAVAAAVAEHLLGNLGRGRGHLGPVRAGREMIQRAGPAQRCRCRPPQSRGRSEHRRVHARLHLAEP